MGLNTINMLVISSILITGMAVAETIPPAIEAGWQGEKTCALLQENENLRAFRCTFPSGTGHERHFHAPHFGYILEGGVMEITDETGTRVQTTPAGASWQSDGVSWHEAINIGETTTSYIIVEPKLASENGRDD